MTTATAESVETTKKRVVTNRSVGDYRLTLKQQEVLDLWDRGMSGAAIATTLGVSKNIINARLRRARALRESQVIRSRRCTDVYAEVKGVYVREVCR